MAQSLGGMSKILSPEALARLQSGQLSDEALSAIKTSAHADFENVVRAKYGDAAVQSLGDAIQRRALIAKLQQAYLSSLGGTHRRSEHLYVKAF